MGAVMGSTVGAVMGLLLGGMAVRQYGPGSQGYMRTVGQYMLGSAATLGLFMNVDSVIRSENYPPLAHRRYQWEK